MEAARPVRERQERGIGVRCFSARLAIPIYNELTDWAWERRISMAKACSMLLTKAMAAEQGEAYIPESKANQHGKEET